MAEIIILLNDLLWDSILVYTLVGVGLFFTVRLGFIQFRHFGHMFAVLKNSRRVERPGISSFQALCTSLAARVGTGNMAGVALALTVGGPGSVFWMWVMAMVGMGTAFAESTLAQLYKTRDEEGVFRGGPANYMEKGLGMRWLGAVFSLFLIIAFGLVFNAVQANTIAEAMQGTFGWNTTYVGFAVAFVAALVIFGGLGRVARTAEIVVPFMALAYLALAALVVAMNLERVPGALLLILESAFGLREATAGGLGYLISQSVVAGVERGLFSNEAGVGSAPNIAASATPHPPHPASQGYVQMLGVFIDTVVICTATVAIVLLSGEYVANGELTGIELIQHALGSQVGDWGNLFIAIAIFFFAFTSIVANYTYAETSLTFLFRNKIRGRNLFRLLVLAMVVYGSIDAAPTIWALAGISMGLMAIVNLMAIVLLSGIVIKLAKDYNRQLVMGRTPKFKLDEYPELVSQLDEEAWGFRSKS